MNYKEALQHPIFEIISQSAKELQDRGEIIIGGGSGDDQLIF